MSILSAAGMVLLAIVIIVLLLIAGVILLLAGFINLFRKKYKGKKSPVICMIAGALMMTLPVILAGFLGIRGFSQAARDFFTPTRYESVPERWRNEWVMESQAESQIIRALLTSADKGDREAFARNFTPETQQKPGFDRAVDAFFAAYPVGLSRCEKMDNAAEDPDQDDAGSGRTGRTSFCCVLDEQWYCAIIGYCYGNDDAPDKVGVTYFRVMNLQAAAVYYGAGQEPDGDGFPVCDIKSPDEYNARLIGGQAYLWETDREPSLSEELLRRILEKTSRLDDPIYRLTIGEPGVVIKHEDSPQFGYFYQIVSQDGEPRYVYFQTDSEYGHILWSFLCTPYEVDYDNPLVKYKKR